MPCELCVLKIRLPLYHEDDVCIVVDCIDCRVPMIVIKRHTPVPTPIEDKYMRGVILRLGFRITRERPRKIKEHVHWHLERTT